MESLNAVLINEGLSQRERLVKLNRIAIQQMRILENLLRAADAESCDFIVLGGDIGNEFSPSALFRGVISKLCETEGSGRPVVMVRGNHELRGKEADRFLDYFGNSEGLS